METKEFFQDKTFSLKYQNCGYGPDGIVMLPAGEYFLTEIEQQMYNGPKWVSIKQKSWKESIKIAFTDFFSFQSNGNFAHL